MPNKALKDARLAKGWRLQDLAEVASGLRQQKVSVPLLSQMENGYDAKPSTRKAVAEALERPVEDLFPGVED